MLTLIKIYWLEDKFVNIELHQFIISCIKLIRPANVFMSFYYNKKLPILVFMAVKTLNMSSPDMVMFSFSHAFARMVETSILVPFIIPQIFRCN